MRVTYVPEHDILQLRFGEPKGRLADKELSPEIHVEVDESGKIVGIEFLSASTHLELRDILPVSYSPSATVAARS